MKDSSIIQNLYRDNNGRINLDLLKKGIDYTLGEEKKGKREKCWLIFSDKRYLVKEVKENTYEDYAELLVEQLCIQLGMPTACYDLATIGGKPCVISEDFVDAPKEKLVSGKTFLSSVVSFLIDNNLYERKCKGDQKELNNLDMIRQCLLFQMPEDKVNEVMKSVDMLFALNCFCLNGDIHLSNWSLIYDHTAEYVYRLSPNYDFGSYFRFNLQKSKIAKHLKVLLRQRKLPIITDFLDNQVFGGEFNKRNSLNFSYDSPDELGLTRFKDAYLREPDRFDEIVQKLLKLDPYKAIEQVENKIGGFFVPDDCMEWFIAVVEANKKRLAQIYGKDIDSEKEEELCLIEK